MNKFDTITVVGLGYIGLPTAAMFAAHNVKVVGVDVNQHTVDTINRGEIHIVEPDLDVAVKNAVANGYLRATTTPDPSDAFLIAVPTPFKGEDHEPDLSYIQSACAAISPVLKAGDLVILESTSPVGTTEKMVGWMADARADLTFPDTAGLDSDIRIAYCPERVLPGKVMQELIVNDRVIGGITQKCADQAAALYKTFVTGACITASNPRVAEMSKLTENSFRDVNIAFANELSMICDELDIDVWELINLSNRHPRVNILQPGPGVGGHCIAVDPWFIVSKSPEIARLIRRAREVNDEKPRWVLDKIQTALGAYLTAHRDKSIKDVKIACYGLAFKPNIDDLRESPALAIALKLSEIYSNNLIVVEPNVEELKGNINHLHLTDFNTAKASADIHILLVDHDEFKTDVLKGVTQAQVIDTRGIW